MKTQIKHVGDTCVVSMDGKLSFENQIPLKEDLDKILRRVSTDAAPKRIIFSLEHLEFVGSSGISAFVQALKDFNLNAPERPRYCHVSSEFRRIMKAFDERDQFEFFETEERARRSFDAAKKIDQ